MTERIGTAEDFARLLAGKPKAEPSAGSEVDEQEQPEQRLVFAPKPSARALFETLHAPIEEPHEPEPVQEVREPTEHEKTTRLLETIRKYRSPRREPQVDFDAGVRETAQSSDPEAEHNAFITELMVRKRYGA